MSLSIEQDIVYSSEVRMLVLAELIGVIGVGVRGDNATIPRCVSIALLL